MNYEEAYGVHQLKGMGFGIPDDYDPWPMRSALQQRACVPLNTAEEQSDEIRHCQIRRQDTSYRRQGSEPL